MTAVGQRSSSYRPIRCFLSPSSADAWLSSTVSGICDIPTVRWSRTNVSSRRSPLSSDDGIRPSSVTRRRPGSSWSWFWTSARSSRVSSSWVPTTELWHANARWSHGLRSRTRQYAELEPRRPCWLPSPSPTRCSHQLWSLLKHLPRRVMPMVTNPAALRLVPLFRRLSDVLSMLPAMWLGSRGGEAPWRTFNCLLDASCLQHLTRFCTKPKKVVAGVASGL